LIPCFFVSDLHGRIDRYQKLFSLIAVERPAAVFLGGDLLPSDMDADPGPEGDPEDFISGYLAGEFDAIRQKLGGDAPEIFLILGNDDARVHEKAVLEAASRGTWHYAHNRRVPFGEYAVLGYSCVPPTPFLLKDWERYDVSRYVDPGCVSPEEGIRTVPAPEHRNRYATIAGDLERLAARGGLERAVCLLHTPPYRTALDQIQKRQMTIDHAPLDRHVGSVAVRKFIETHQPLLSLHGHIHESARLSGKWRDMIGGTPCCSAAHDGPELALIRIDLENPGKVRRELL